MSLENVSEALAFFMDDENATPYGSQLASRAQLAFYEITELVEMLSKASPVLWDALSKLESQIARNPDLPVAYNEIVVRAAALLRKVDDTLLAARGQSHE